MPSQTTTTIIFFHYITPHHDNPTNKISPLINTIATSTSRLYHIISITETKISQSTPLPPPQQQTFPLLTLTNTTTTTTTTGKTIVPSHYRHHDHNIIIRGTITIPGAPPLSQRQQTHQDCVGRAALPNKQAHKRAGTRTQIDKWIGG